MFNDAKSFNQPLNNWDVSNVENMVDMFVSAISFNQDINMWDDTKANTEDMFFNSGMKTLPEWYDERGYSDDYKLCEAINTIFSNK